MSKSMKAQVSEQLISEFEIRAECLEEEEPEAAQLVRDAIMIIRDGRKPTGLTLAALIAELRVIEGFDAFQDKASQREIFEAQAYLGDLEFWDDGVVVSTKKRKALIIDGIKYQTY